MFRRTLPLLFGKSSNSGFSGHHLIRDKLSNDVSKKLNKKIMNQKQSQVPSFEATVHIHHLRLYKVFERHLLKDDKAYYIGKQGPGVDTSLREGDVVKVRADSAKYGEVTIMALVKAATDAEHLEALKDGRNTDSELRKYRNS